MNFIKDFKEFALKGNVVDMSIGVIIGGAFGKVTSSFVNDVVMPPLGLLVGGIDFKEYQLTLKAAGPASKAVTLNYGAFATSVLDFLIMAFAVFLAIKGVSALRREKPPAPSEKVCPECRSRIPLEATRCAHCAQPQPQPS